MNLRRTHFLLPAMLFCTVERASAQSWSDDMEAYTPGSTIEGQGGWAAWDGLTTSFTTASTAQAASGTQSMETLPGADTVYPITGIDAGSGTFSHQLYVPSTTTGIFHLSIMDEYSDGGLKEWGAWLRFDTSTGVVESDCGGAAIGLAALTYDAWVEVRVELDLDADTVELFYGGVSMCTYIWSEGYDGFQSYAPIALEAIDIFPDPLGVGPYYLDDFCLDWNLGGIGTNYCISTPNSTGFPAVISGSGSDSVAANDLLLRTEPVPNQNGVFFYGPLQSQVPFGNGFLCIGAGATGIARLSVETGVMNVITHALDNTAPPTPATQITAGSTWNFSTWYRDPLGGGAFFNASNGLSITFTP